MFPVDSLPSSSGSSVVEEEGEDRNGNLNIVLYYERGGQGWKLMFII